MLQLLDADHLPEHRALAQLSRTFPVPVWSHIWRPYRAGVIVRLEQIGG